ncbi:peptidase, M23 domain protein, partial [Leptospira santarosai str. 2000027870]|uniref:M23 family metallopeptidase n=2 Tax=Leptospira santarosai TaxID=28183 RepID=UPI0002BF6B18
IEQAKTDAESKAAQDKNNSEQGAQVLEGYGVRRDEEFNFTADGEAESSDNIGGDNGKGKKPTLNEVEAMMNRHNKIQEGLDSIRNTKTTHYDTANQEGSNIVRSVKTESGENGKTKITIDRMGNVGFDAETTPFFSRDSKGNLVPVTDAHVSSPFTGHRDVTNSAHNGIDVISHAFRASADLEVTGVTHGASRNVGGDPGKQAGIWVQDGKLMTYLTRDANGKPLKSPQQVEYTAAIAAHDGVSAQDHSTLLNHAMSNPNQYHGNGNSVTGRYTMGDGTKVDLIYKHAPSLEGLQLGKPVTWQKGDTIHQGSMVLNVGSTGRSTGPHAHFEVQSRSTFGLDPNKHADLIHKIKGTNTYAIDGRYFTNNILKKDLENQ